MKLRLLSGILAGLILTGCGAGESAGNMTDMGENMIDQLYGIENSESTEASNAADAGEQASQEEPYVLSFEAATIEGETMTSDCFGESRLTMLNIWATYCNPCLSEMPDLGQIATSYDKADFQMIGIISDVAEDADDEMVEEAKSLIEQTQANYPHLLLSESLYTNLVSATSAVPTTFFVNQKGEVLGYVVGAGSKENWEEIINELLAETP